jgi:hypothetical protein
MRLNATDEVDRGTQPRGGRVENRKQAVAFTPRLYEAAAVNRNASVRNIIVRLKRFRHLRRMFFPQARAADHIGHNEGDNARR